MHRRQPKHFDADPYAPPANRFCCQKHLFVWRHAFARFFPRKAHRQHDMAVAIAKAESYHALRQSLVLDCHDGLNAQDGAHAKARLVNFTEDRMTLIHSCRIKPDAADLFLAHFPPGTACYNTKQLSGNDDLFNENQCYYGDEEHPSAKVSEIIEQQRKDAIGKVFVRLTETDRLAHGYMPMIVMRALFKFLDWDFTPDQSPEPDARNFLPILRVGWVADPELGAVECFALPSYVCAPGLRDELQLMVSSVLFRRPQFADSPYIVLFNRPLRQHKNGKTYTVIGSIHLGLDVMLLYYAAGKGFADTFVACTGVSPTSSAEIEDSGGEFFDRYMATLGKAGIFTEESPARYLMRPDGWMVPLN